MTIQIKEIIIHQLQMKLSDPFTTSFGTFTDKEFLIIEAIDVENNHGFGESVAFSSPWYTEETVQTNLHIIEDFLIGILKESQIDHPDEVSALFASIKGNNMAKAAVECAIWDLYAKQKQVSLSQALGGKKQKIDVGISLGIEPTIKDLRNQIDFYLQQGYKRIKVKIKPGQDIDVLHKIRESYPTVPLMADANSAYTLEDIDHLKKMDHLDLLMIEQPLAHDDIIDHAAIQAELNTPICLDESILSLADAKKAIQLGSCQIINIKVGRVGGLTEAKRIHDYCLEKGIAVWCGGMLEAGIGRAHNIALASLPQFILPGDIGGSSRYWKKDIILPEVMVQNGVIDVPDQAGIGFTINHETFKKHTVDKKRFLF